MAYSDEIVRNTRSGDQAMFLVWGPPSHGPRSRVLARELDIAALYYIHATTRRGWSAAPFKYSYQALATVWLVLWRRPRIIFVQSPPSLAVLVIYLYCVLSGARYIVDAHSDALQRRIWMWPGWLHGVLIRSALTTIVTSEHYQDHIQQRGGRAFVLRDIPTVFERGSEYALDGSFNVVVVNTFARDEPLAEVLEAAKTLPHVHFYVTGKLARATPHVVAGAAHNVHFTDFLPDQQYYALLAAADVVMCLTTRDHTMQRGACEALSLGKPIITSDWPLLRAYFNQGTVHVANTSSTISQGVRTMHKNYAQYQAEIKALQIAQHSMWQAAKVVLTDMIREAGIGERMRGA